MSTLFVASAGGHLAELLRLCPRLDGLPSDVTWVTFDTPQSRSLLAGEDVVYVRYTRPRDYRSVAVNSARAASLLQGGRVRAVVSTGAGIALSFFAPARARGLDCHYIESAARSRSPSLTGALLSRLPGMQLYCQYPGWATGPWRYAGSVWDGFAAVERDPAPIRRVVVMLGTMKFPFRRLIDRLVQVLPTGADVLWQVGETETALSLTPRVQIPEPELMAAARDADVVVAHAGAGAALTALDAGRLPILVPRLRQFGEHVDDHQLEMAGHLEERGLALARSPDALTAADLERAAALQVTHERPPPFGLSLRETA